MTSAEESLRLDRAHPVRTGPSVPPDALVFHNRVPKCASRAMFNALKGLADRNRFLLATNFSLDVGNLHLDYTEREWNQVAAEISALPPNSVAVAQIAFLDFSKIGKDFPLYTTVVRHPLDRFVSSYYYRLHGAYHRRSDQRKPIDPSEESVDDCIMRNVTECVQATYRSLVQFFCGTAVTCRTMSAEALTAAKQHLVMYYAAVGIFEDLPGTLQLFQKLLPRYFLGAEEFFFDESVLQKSKTIGRREASEVAKSALRVALQRDIEFYDFVRMRFDKQKAALGLIT